MCFNSLLASSDPQYELSERIFWFGLVFLKCSTIPRIDKWHEISQTTKERMCSTLRASLGAKLFELTMKFVGSNFTQVKFVCIFLRKHFIWDAENSIVISPPIEIFFSLFLLLSEGIFFWAASCVSHRWSVRDGDSEATEVMDPEDVAAGVKAVEVSPAFFRIASIPTLWTRLGFFHTDSMSWLFSIFICMIFFVVVCGRIFFEDKTKYQQ